MSGVNVLAVMDRLGKEWRDDSQIVGRLDSADALDSVRAAVAELIEAGMAATEEKMHDGASSREACERLIAALSRVRGAA